MQKISGKIQQYPWGSTKGIADLRGLAPSSTPEAELWFGAHPSMPSDLLYDDDTPTGQDLQELIESDSEGQLGVGLANTYGRLPFLLKILAVDAPLSIQAHPDKTRAQQGFEQENAQGIDVQSPLRNYKDDNHKPELIVALTPFQALAGFRPPEQTLELFRLLDLPSQYSAQLSGSGTQGFKDLLEQLLNSTGSAKDELLGVIEKGLVSLESTLSDDPGNAPQWLSATLRVMKRVMEHHPDDTGVFSALLLNAIELEPQEGLFLGAGQLHAYVSGVGVEIMANSDNVLRGGLTVKHIDIPELLSVLDFDSPTPSGFVGDQYTQTTYSKYPVPTSEFSLVRSELSSDESIEIGPHSDIQGPAIVLVVSGTVDALSDQELELNPTEALWVGYGEHVTLRARTRSTVFIASTGDDEDK